jgi:hypothetical protein
MAQSLPRFCPRCGTETTSQQKFCPKCGLDMSEKSAVQLLTQSSEQSAEQSPHPTLEQIANPSSDAGLEPLPNRKNASSPDPEYPVNEEADLSMVQPSVEEASPSSAQPPDSPVMQASSSNDMIESLPTQELPQPQVEKPPQSSMQAQVRSTPPSPPALQGGGLDIRRIRILLVLMVVLVGVGVGVVVLFQVLSTPVQPAITKTSLGTTVNYAGVDITVVSAQKSQLFLDDPHSASDGMLRLLLRAQNKTSLSLNFSYAAITHVTLPNGKVVSPTYVQHDEHLAPNATVQHDEHLAPSAAGSDLVDFAVPQNVRVDQVIFHLGGVDEAQLDIPLNGHANVDQYASKTVHPNQPLSFYGLNWSLTDASLQFHIDGHQASKGMRYLILTLKVDNPLFEKAIPGSPLPPDGYAQLQANNTSINPIDTTLPVSFEAGVTGKIGTLTFLVPQDATTFTLTLSNLSDGFDGSNGKNMATFQV